ncbi:hypothetical protein LSTR_LSTR007077 [Laodelphax striatellus]|uniref:Serpin domain-containing protein n=1 Tax=Laodelphax striatellus TaxID=195883 RepID=A0A482WEL6_LAOST|nr:hypothetical protein LSTR_LSTR007077 [Laodelphax striatellus]
MRVEVAVGTNGKVPKLAATDNYETESQHAYPNQQSSIKPVFEVSVCYVSGYVGVLWASILVFGQQKPRDTAVEITNDFSICLLQVIATPKSNAIFSPYGLVSVSVLIYEGANHSSQSAQQIERALRLPANSNTTQMGFRDLHMTMRASKYFTSDGFLRGLVLSNPKAVLHRSYLEKLKYYGFEPDVSSILTTTTMIPTTTAMPANKTTEKEMVNKTTTKPPTTTTMKPTTELSGEDASTATSGAGSGSTEELTTTPPTDASVESKDGRADLDTTTVPSTMRTTAGDSSTNAEEGSTEGSGSTETENSREPLTEAPTSITTTPVPPTTGIKKSTTVDQDETSLQTPEESPEESASTDAASTEAASTDNTDAASTEAASTSGSSEGGGGGEDSSTSASTADDGTTSEDASQIPEQKTEASGITVANAMVSMLEAQQPETSTMMIDSQVTTAMDTVAAPTTSSADVTTSSTDGATSSSDSTTSNSDSATSNSDAAATESVATERTTTETTTTTTVPAEITTEPTTTSPVEETTATLLDAVTISPPSMREANEIEEKLGQLKALITSSLKENAKRLGILSKFEKFKQLDEEHEKRLGTFDSASPSTMNNSTSNDTDNDDVLSKMSIKTLFSDWVTIVPALSGSNEDYNYPFEESTEEKTVSTTDDDIFGRSRDNKPPATVRDREYEDYVSGGSGEDLLMTSSRRGGASVLEAKKREVVGVGGGGNGNATKNITKRSISGGVLHTSNPDTEASARFETADVRLAMVSSHGDNCLAADHPCLHGGTHIHNGLTYQPR